MSRLVQYLSWFLHLVIVLLLAAIVFDVIRLAYHQDYFARTRGKDEPRNIDYSTSLIQHKPVCQCGTDDVSINLEVQYLSWLLCLVIVLLFIERVDTIRVAYHQDYLAHTRGNDEPRSIDYSRSLIQRKPVCQCETDELEVQYLSLLLCLVFVLLLIERVDMIRVAYHQDYFAHNRGNEDAVNPNFSTSQMQQIPISCQRGPDNIPEASLGAAGTSQNSVTDVVERELHFVGATSVDSTDEVSAEISDSEHLLDSSNRAEDSMSSIGKQLLKSGYRAWDSISLREIPASSDGSNSSVQYQQSEIPENNCDSESTDSDEEADGGALQDLEDSVSADGEQLPESSYHIGEPAPSSGSTSSNGRKSSDGNNQPGISGNNISSESTDGIGEAGGAVSQIHQTPEETFVKAGCEDILPDEMK